MGALGRQHRRMDLGRRARGHGLSIRITKERPAELSVGGLALETARRRARFGGSQTELTPSECVLPGTLIDHAGCMVGRTLLYEELWGFDPSLRSRAIDVYVASLRRKHMALPWQALPFFGVSRLTASGDRGRLRRRAGGDRWQRTSLQM